MKRSEMLDKIREKLEGQIRKQDYAKEILDTVEELGMLPPAINSQDLLLDNSWELEDDA